MTTRHQAVPPHLQAPRLLRRALGATARLSPALAARLSYPLFMTPRRYAAPERERAVLAQARGERLRLAGREVQSYRWGAGPTVLLVHGWAGRGAQLGDMVEPLLGEGLQVVALDFPGHGASRGRRTTIREMSAQILELAHREGGLAGLVAHSLGGLASLSAVAAGAPTRRLALISAPSAVEPLMDIFAAAVGVDQRVRRRLQELVEARVGLPMAHYDSRWLKPRVRIPTLLVHDREDRDVPWQEAERLSRDWPAAQLHLSQGLGHRRILRDPAVVSRVTQFLAEPAQDQRQANA